VARRITKALGGEEHDDRHEDQHHDPKRDATGDEPRWASPGRRRGRTGLIAGPPGVSFGPDARVNQMVL
jgi:hypothetical protein